MVVFCNLPALIKSQVFLILIFDTTPTLHVNLPVGSSFGVFIIGRLRENVYVKWSLLFRTGLGLSQDASDLDPSPLFDGCSDRAVIL